MATDTGGGNLTAIAIEAEFVKISQDQIREGFQQALQLFGGFRRVKVGTGGFGFDVTDDEVVTVPHAKVGVAGFSGLGKHGHDGFHYFQGKIRK